MSELQQKERDPRLDLRSVDEAVDTLLRDLRWRRGFNHVWDDLDAEVIGQIRDKWTEIVSKLVRFKSPVETFSKATRLGLLELVPGEGGWWWLSGPVPRVAILDEDRRCALIATAVLAEAMLRALDDEKLAKLGGVPLNEEGMRNLRGHVAQAIAFLRDLRKGDVMVRSEDKENEP